MNLVHRIVFPITKSHYFRTSPFSTSREIAISKEVLNIVDTVNPMEPALEQIAPFLSTEIITSVLQQQPNPGLCFRFFIWAARRNQFQSWCSHNLVIQMLVTNDEIDLYWEILKELKNSNIPIPSEAFAVLISGYWKLQKADKAVETFGKMNDFNCKPNTFTFNMIMHIMVKIDMIPLALAVYSMMVKSNCKSNCSTYSILINGLCESGKTAEALKLFDEMTQRGIMPNELTYSIVLQGLCQAERIDDAYRLFNSMKSSSCKPDLISYNSLLNGVCKLGWIDEAFDLLRSYKNDGFEIDLNGYSCLIDALFGAKRFKEAHDMFQKVIEADIKPDVVLHTIMIHGLCEEGRLNDALQWLRNMTESGTTPDTQCYNTLIKGFCDMGFLDQARALKLEMSEVNCFPDSCTYTILISGMCRQGLVDEALDIFKEMEKLGCNPSVVTFNALIHGLCNAGKNEEARLLFYKMEIGRNPSLFLRLSQGLDKDVNSGSLQTLAAKLCESGNTLNAYKLLKQLADAPNIRTYNILIDGMCKAGKIDDAFKIFKELQLKGSSPDAVTYSTLINGLQRVGREDEAFMLFEQMFKKGCMPSPAIYKSLMTWSCRREKISAAFILWLKYLESLPNREKDEIKLVEQSLQEGQVERAIRGLLEMDLKLRKFDSGPYNILLIGFCQGHKTGEALKVFRILEEYGINVTPPSCVMLIRSLCRDGNLDQATEVFLYALDKGFMLKKRICNNLLRSLLSSKEKAEHALDILNKMKCCGYNLEVHLYNSTKFLLYRHLNSPDMMNVPTG